jgi:outer membrane protein assembly factor BamD (BamD/ComL family)
MATPSAAPSANARGAVAPEKDVLAQEIRLIDEARARLRKADPQGSLETLSRYDQLVKHGGSMRAEATVVRIEAYQKSGDTARAAALGQRFLDKNPDSPYVDYVKRMLARAN